MYSNQSSCKERLLRTKILISDPKTRSLDIEGNELNKAWDQFRNTLPLEERVQFEKRAQTVADVVKVVEDVEREWRQKKRKGFSGQTKTWFRKICNTLDSHSTLLELLPSSSQYASVFCGTLQTLIKVSVKFSQLQLQLLYLLLTAALPQGIGELREDC